jgi:hypothetical protein
MKRALIAGLVLISLLGVVQMFRGVRGTDDGGDDTLLFDRLWVDRAPHAVDDRLQVLLVMAKPAPGLAGRKLGSFVAGTLWQGAWVNFVHEREGAGKLKLHYPAGGKDEKVRYRSQRCEEPGFDMCLELHGSSHGVRKYYSRHNWKVRPRAAAGAELERLLRQASSAGQ